jgi:hypothetical protein
MKKVAILITAILIAAAGCKKEETIIRHDVMIRGKQSLTTSKSETHLTPVEVAKEATYIVYRVKEWGWNPGKLYIIDGLRDTVNGILMRNSWDILDPSNYALDSAFITGKDMVLERYLNGWTLQDGINWPHIDTIGYIPNSVLKNAYDLIIPAFKNKQWQEIYDIFNEKFVFLPITGAEYRELVRTGLN